MKKLILSICILLSICFILSSGNNKTSAKVNDKLIRFHVIANSDSDSDQSTKLKVRDAVLNDIGPKLADSKSVEESLSIIEKNKDRIESIANKILKNEGKNYTAKALIGKYNFPVKNYGTITLPAGEYTALRVVLGNGDGKNWWCVMFPPLCFIDVTKGLSSEDTEGQLRRVMSEKEVKSITAFKQQPSKQEVVINSPKSGSEKVVTAAAKSSEIQNSSSSNSESQISKIEFRFKSAEILKKVIDKFKILFNE